MPLMLLGEEWFSRDGDYTPVHPKDYKQCAGVEGNEAQIAAFLTTSRRPVVLVVEDDIIDPKSNALNDVLSALEKKNILAASNVIAVRVKKDVENLLVLLEKRKISIDGVVLDNQIPKNVNSSSPNATTIHDILPKIRKQNPQAYIVFNSYEGLQGLTDSAVMRGEQAYDALDGFQTKVTELGKMALEKGANILSFKHCYSEGLNSSMEHLKTHLEAVQREKK